MSPENLFCHFDYSDNFPHSISALVNNLRMSILSDLSIFVPSDTICSITLTCNCWLVTVVTQLVITSKDWETIPQPRWLTKLFFSNWQNVGRVSSLHLFLVFGNFSFAFVRTTLHFASVIFTIRYSSQNNSIHC